ncbi:hypothetical protein QE152_g7353 [Popillia japonica]|uniref:Uncharacterized protein n=1 Tax=Popillia japonica TaxID=7064 RepID=A0AAW1MFL7_POPJA
MLSTCLGRNLRSSKSNIEKLSVPANPPNERHVNPCELPVKQSKNGVEEAITQPTNLDLDRFVPRYNPPDKCESVDSQDVAMINIIREMASEERRLAEEVDQLTERETAFKKVMDFCSTMHNDQNSSADTPEIAKLKSINQDLINKNKNLTDNLADAKLELKQLKEVIGGPLKRELERARRQCLECECKYNEAKGTNTEAANNEILFLREQLENTCNNINDIHAVNAEIKQEVIVLNHKCKKLQELLVKNKVDEINTLKEICTCSDR